MRSRLFTLSPLVTVYLLSFFVTLQGALPAYVSSSFLAAYAPEKFVGIIFTAESFLTILALIGIPVLLRAVGDYLATAFFIAIEIAALLGLAVFHSAGSIIALFIISAVAAILISFDFDLIVEKFSRNAETGSVRGLYLASADVAWVIAPTLAAGVLGADEYWRVYLASAAILIPAFFLFLWKLDRFADPLYRRVHFKQTLRSVWRNRNLRYLFSAAFLLQFFFTLMVIYTPLYLHETLGFPWSALGIMFSIMLVPFLLLEAPLGRLADRRLGEKEMLIAGFIVTALATAAMSFSSAAIFALWTVMLFLTRVGAATIEIMTETYFFKKVDGQDANLVSFERALRPIAGVVAPLAATAFLLFFPLKFLFVALGALMLLGVPASLALQDTK